MPVSYYSFPVPLRVGGWVDLSIQWVSNLLKLACKRPAVRFEPQRESCESDTLTTGPLASTYWIHAQIKYSTLSLYTQRLDAHPDQHTGTLTRCTNLFLTLTLTSARRRRQILKWLYLQSIYSLQRVTHNYVTSLWHFTAAARIELHWLTHCSTATAVKEPNS